MNNLKYNIEFIIHFEKDYSYVKRNARVKIHIKF